MTPLDKTSRTFTLGENDACIIFRDAPEQQACKIDITLETRHMGQNHLPERESASYLALLASSPFQDDEMAQFIRVFCERHLAASGGIDPSPEPKGEIQ